MLLPRILCSRSSSTAPASAPMISFAPPNQATNLLPNGGWQASPMSVAVDAGGNVYFNDEGPDYVEVSSRCHGPAVLYGRRRNISSNFGLGIRIAGLAVDGAATSSWGTTTLDVSLRFHGTEPLMAPRPFCSQRAKARSVRWKVWPWMDKGIFTIRLVLSPPARRTNFRAQPLVLAPRSSFL